MDKQPTVPDVGQLLRSIRLETRRKELTQDEREPPDWTLFNTHASTMQESMDLIGRVNPRGPGWHNRIIQLGKRIVARGLEWRVRSQRIFNFSVMESVAALHSAGESNERNLERLRTGLRALVETQEQGAARTTAELHQVQAELTHALSHEAGCLRQEMEERERVVLSELRSLGEELQTVRDRLSAEQSERRSLGEELRKVHSAISAEYLPVEDVIDYFSFEKRMRGDEEEVRSKQSVYLPYFRSHAPVVDIGCGRGEFLQLLMAEGIDARGVDRHPSMAAHCASQGLSVIQGDFFEYLAQQSDDSLGGVFCAQVIEHLAPRRLVELIQLSFSKLRSGGIAVFETQNPQCLLSIAGWFWLDPSHRRPIHPQQLLFLMEMVGFHTPEVLWLNECEPEHRLPRLGSGTGNRRERQRFNAAIERFNQVFLGPADYAVLGTK